MESIDFKRFMFEQKIKQSDLAKYLGVSEGYISLVASGKKKLSKDNFGKVLNNPYGWDVSMLTGNEPEVPAESDPSDESIVIALLKEQNAELQAKVDMLNQRVGELKALLKREEEVAGAAGGSLSATAV